MSEAATRWLRHRNHLMDVFFLILVPILLIFANIAAVNIPQQQIIGTEFTVFKNVDKITLEVGQSLDVTITVRSYISGASNVTVKDWFPQVFVLMTPYSTISSVSKVMSSDLVELIWKVKVDGFRSVVFAYELRAVSAIGDLSLPSAEVSWGNSSAHSQEDIRIKIVETSLINLISIEISRLLEQAGATLIVTLVVGVTMFFLGRISRRIRKE